MLLKFLIVYHEEVLLSIFIAHDLYLKVVGLKVMQENVLSYIIYP